MHLEFEIATYEDAARIQGYVWALRQPPHAEWDEMACFNACHEAMIKGTPAEEDWPNEAWCGDVLRWFERGAEDAMNLIRADVFLSAEEAANRAGVTTAYIYGEARLGRLKTFTVKGRRGKYIHPDDFRDWMANPLRGSRRKAK